MMENLTFENLNLYTLIPMIILTLGALGIICIDIAKKGLSRSFYAMLSILFLTVSLAFVVASDTNVYGFFNMLIIDGTAKLAQIIILVASLLFAPLILSGKEFDEHKFAEYFAFLLFAVTGFLFMVSTNNLILIFVGLETASLALYAMIAMHNKNNAIEAALKYFTMGALSSGFFAMGAMILYALTSSVDINIIVQTLAQRDFEPMIATLGALAFILASFAFKLSIIPFHTWTPDVYEGSTAALAGYMSVVPKTAGFIVIIRLFETLIDEKLIWANDILYLLAVVTMTLSNIMALVQSDVKRMLAFSSISHVGFILCAVLIGSKQANEAIFLYLILFMFVNFGAFTLLWIARNKENLYDERYQHPYSKFSGMIKIAPMGAVIMALFMLSLAGIPPFSIFWGKIYIMSAAIQEGFIILAVIMALNSAIAVYYYLRLVVYMFLKEPLQTDGTVYIENASKPLMVVVGIAAITAVAAIFFVEPIITVIGCYL
ncbi:MAG: NADH-quinone oxidoreductase subunit NuoN [Campylobacteraceae bacterium]|nr:NADH-quinone oxidoreductase subunit NuoN [Campylobacteraceae bacterium]